MLEVLSRANKLGAAVFVVSLGLCAHVHAVPLDVKGSVIKATFTQFNVPVTGQFKQFSGDVNFDAAKPEAAQGLLTVQTASYDLGDPQYNKEVAGKDWFDSKNHPTGTFKLNGVKAAAGGYTASGELTLRGKSKAVQFPVKLATGPKANVFTGELVIKRLEFGIGQGDWADTSLVADPVKIEFKLSVPK